MKLWLISQQVNNDYDTYDSAVVAEETAAWARLVHPSGRGVWEEYDGTMQWVRTDVHGNRYIPCDTWTNPAHVEVRYLGEACSQLMRGVVCASFNSSG